MIKNIIFDIGNVLMQFNPMKFLKNKYNDADLIDKLYKEIFCSNEWQELDRGTITQEEATDVFCKRDLSNEKYIRNVMDTFHTMLIPMKNTPDILTKLKHNGYKIYLLSNYHSRTFKMIYKQYSFLRLSDGGIISCDVNFLKPDRRIYDCLIKKYGIKPEESVFIDDTLDNIEAARKINFKGVHFKSAEDLKVELEKMGVNF